MKHDVSTITDKQAEAGVIATLMYHPEFILQTDYLKPKYFYYVENGCIYWAISELYKNGVETIDALNISNMLNSNKAVKMRMEQCNLTNMQEFIEMSKYVARHTIEEYKLLVNNVVVMSFKRDLDKISVEIQAACFNASMNLSDLNNLVNTKISRLTEQYITTNEIVLFGSKVEDLWNEVCGRRNESGIYGIPSKFSLINDYVTYEDGELCVLKARMKRGKSAFFLNEAIHKIISGVPTLYIDTEMQDRLFYERMLANLTGISIRNIKTGNYSYDEEMKLKDTNEWLKKQPFVHVYMPQSSDDEIYAIHKILKYKMNLSFSIYDYIKSNDGDGSQLSNLLGQKTDFLKNRVAGELNLPILAGCQLGRTMMTSDSDKIDRYISTSMIWREKTAEEIAAEGLDAGNYCLRIDLNRNGQQMDEDEKINFIFNGDTMTIKQAKIQLKDMDKTPFG